MKDCLITHLLHRLSTHWCSLLDLQLRSACSPWIKHKWFVSSGIEVYWNYNKCAENCANGWLTWTIAVIWLWCKNNVCNLFIFFTITWLEMLYKQSNKTNLIWKIAYFKHQISGNFFYISHNAWFNFYKLIYKESI